MKEPFALTDSEKGQPDILRFNEGAKTYERKRGKDWVRTDAARTRVPVLGGCSGGYSYSYNIGYTTYRDFNAEPETSAKAPRSILAQCAKTGLGHAMQIHAEQVCAQDDKATQSAYEKAEQVDETRDAVASYFVDRHLKMSSDGQLEVNPNTDSETLRRIRENLMDVRLAAEIRQTMRKLIGKVDQAIRKREVAEAPEKVTKNLTIFADLQIQIRTAISQRNFRDLGGLNEKLFEVTLEILDGLGLMRNTNPNAMIELLEEIRGANGPLNLYKSALLEYTRTHNTFRFSPETMDGLEYQAKRDERFAQQRGGKPSFTQALLEAYRSPKRDDDPYTFALRLTRIPEHKFRELVQKALKEA